MVNMKCSIQKLGSNTLSFVIKVFTFFLFLNCNLSSFAVKSFQPKQLLHLNTQQGLSHSGVTALLKDSRGYVWIATYDGLCRYNGNNFVVFKNRVNEILFDSNRIRSLFEDKNGNIWIGTDQGIVMYDYSQGEFIKLKYTTSHHEEENYIVRHIFSDPQGEHLICYTESEGALIYNLEGRFVRRDNLRNMGKYTGSVAMGEGKQLLSTSNGLYLHNISKGDFELIDELGQEPVVSMTKLSDSTLLLGLTLGLQKLAVERHEGEYEFKVEGELMYPDLKFDAITTDGNNVLWLGVFKEGLAYISTQDEGLGDASINYLGNKSRISNIVSLNNGVTWVTTFDNGVFSYSSVENPFRHLIVDEEFHNIKSPVVKKFDDRHCLVQPLFEDVRMLDVKTGKQKKLTVKLPSGQEGVNGIMLGLNQDKEFSIFKNPCHHIIINQDKEVKIDYQKRLEDVFKSDIRCYIKDRENNQDWIGHINDLKRVSYSEKGDILRVESIHSNPFFQNKNIKGLRTIFVDSLTQSVWVGTESQGLYKIDMPAGSLPLSKLKITQYKHQTNNAYSISSNFVSAFVRHPNGTLYVGTEQGGFCKVDESKSELEFKTYSETEGLSNNVVKSLICDDEGYLWVATNIGLNRFDVENESFRSYRTLDGLPFEEFWYDVQKMTDGTLVFSGINNVMMFNPEDLSKQELIPNIEFVGLSFLSDNKNETTDKIMLSEGLPIELDYDQNIFSVKLDVLYEKQSSNHYLKYQLLPLSKTWITIPATVDEISFNGLPAGQYLLKVKASNFLGEWSESKALRIIVKPPYYKSTLAYIIYLIVFIVLTIVIVRSLVRFKLLKHSLKLEMFKKEKLEELNEEKQRYFSNISHELRTPLTLISAPVEVLMERFSKDKILTKELLIIKRQSKKMLELVDLALGFRLEESNLLQRENSTFGFHTFIRQLIDDFDFMAEYDRKHLVVNHYDKAIFVNADSSMLEKIINNLLNNAFKYTKADDTITVSYEVEEEKLIIKVADTGYGIAQDDIPRIFERFYQGKKRANIGGTGIGLAFTRRLVNMHEGEISVESELGQGTVFTVVMPIISTIEFEDDQLIESAEETLHLSELQGQVIEDIDIEKFIIEKKVSDSVIYIVEDNTMMREFLVDTVSRFFHVKAFANGADCLEAMKDSWPGLIVSDVMMPMMDGFELCRNIKNNISTSHIPVVLLTACGNVDQRLEGLDAGADAYIPKPFHPKHLLKRIETLLCGRMLLSERYQIGIPLIKGNNQGINAKDNEFLEKLYKVYADNLDNEEMDIDTICTKLGNSRSALFQKVKALTDSSPSQLFRNYKLKRAADMLEKGDINVNEVCYSIGFKSRSTFSRLFKEKYGISPSKYASTKKEEKQ